MDELWSHIGISGIQVLGVMLATTTLYVVYAGVIRYLGRRIRASTSTFSLALATLMGALIARSMLGDSPTLLGGLVALATLMGLEASFGVLRRRLPRRGRPGRHQPTVILVDGMVLPAALATTGLHEHEIVTRLRQQGVTSYQDLALVILESSGALTVLRTGSTIHQRFLWDVRGAGDLPEALVDNSATH
ncbi:YetF domain-containing protein [Enemella sp. A6]|uniref:YetF domain-containing protein n=1 Tax=Enemella sp. A6 TaxID=3440152 RepID=UPI003EBD8526